MSPNSLDWITEDDLWTGGGTGATVPGGWATTAPGWASGWGSTWGAPEGTLGATSSPGEGMLYDMQPDVGWYNTSQSVPMEKKTYQGGLPNYFKSPPTKFSGISPVGMAALIRMFNNVVWPLAEVKEYEQKPVEYETVYTTPPAPTPREPRESWSSGPNSGGGGGGGGGGGETPGLKATQVIKSEPVKAQTAWALPSLPSAQTYRRMAAGGALSPFESYLDLQDEALKNQFMQQARALWPIENKRAQVNWKTAKQ